MNARGTVPLFPILSVNFVGMLGFSIVLPFLVFLVTKWGGNALVYGLLGATYSTFQLIGAPILGRWSDRYGRRRILLLSQLGTLISWCVLLTAFLLPARTLVPVESGVPRSRRHSVGRWEPRSSGARSSGCRLRVPKSSP